MVKNRLLKILGIIASIGIGSGCATVKSHFPGYEEDTCQCTAKCNGTPVNRLEELSQQSIKPMYPVNETGVCTDVSYLPHRDNGKTFEVVIFKGPAGCGRAGGSKDPYCQALYLCIDGKVKDIGFYNDINGGAHIATGYSPGDYKACNCVLGDARPGGKTAKCCVTPAGNFIAKGKQRNHTDYSKVGWYYLEGSDIGGTDITGNNIALHDYKEGPLGYGKRKSHGCIRMLRSDMKKLYNILNNGDSITVRPDGVNNKKR